MNAYECLRKEMAQQLQESCTPANIIFIIASSVRLISYMFVISYVFKVISYSLELPLRPVLYIMGAERVDAWLLYDFGMHLVEFALVSAVMGVGCGLVLGKVLMWVSVLRLDDKPRSSSVPNAKQWERAWSQIDREVGTGENEYASGYHQYDESNTVGRRQVTVKQEPVDDISTSITTDTREYRKEYRKEDKEDKREYRKEDTQEVPEPDTTFRYTYNTNQTSMFE